MHVVKVDHLAFLILSANFGTVVTQRLGKPLGVCLFGVLYQKRHEKRLKSSVMPCVFNMRFNVGKMPNAEFYGSNLILTDLDGLLLLLARLFGKAPCEKGILSAVLSFFHLLSFLQGRTCPRAYLVTLDADKRFGPNHDTLITRYLMQVQCSIDC